MIQGLSPLGDSCSKSPPVNTDPSHSHPHSFRTDAVLKGYFSSRKTDSFMSWTAGSDGIRLNPPKKSAKVMQRLVWSLFLTGAERKTHLSGGQDAPSTPPPSC